ncbi:MAG TPA: hypothetical protein VMU22_04645 [Rhizomicrobium sp.]|nr:hypothetical protein [Rhizomicrobium sp.]
MAMTTFYLYRRNERSGQIEGPCGTGFAVVIPSAVHGEIPHAYAVTSLHVIQAGASIIRFTRLVEAQEGRSIVKRPAAKFIEFNPEEWHFIPAGDDVAAIEITDHIGHDDDLLTGIPETDFAHLGFIREARVSLGEDVFMVGLFTGNPGIEINHVAARFGNLSQLASDKHPVVQGHGYAHPSHVIDMHSRPGFSGSPVMIYRTPYGDLTAIDQEGRFLPNLNSPYLTFVKLLGIHSGQFEERIGVERAESYGAQPIKEGDTLTVQSSMTIVVPAWKIQELLHTQHFKDQRMAREKEARQKHVSRVQPEVASAELRDANPDHKEDFTRLLNAASRKRPQDDQT